MPERVPGLEGRREEGGDAAVQRRDRLQRAAGPCAPRGAANASLRAGDTGIGGDGVEVAKTGTEREQKRRYGRLLFPVFLSARNFPTLPRALRKRCGGGPGRALRSGGKHGGGSGVPSLRLLLLRQHLRRALRDARLLPRRAAVPAGLRAGSGGAGRGGGVGVGLGR